MNEPIPVQVDVTLTVITAVSVLYVGRFFTTRLCIFRDFNIPEAVTGGLPVALHRDVDMPFPRPDQDPYLAEKRNELFQWHPNTVIIWAHVVLGRVVRPVEKPLKLVEHALCDPALKHVHFDMSWDEAARFLVDSSETVRATADLFNHSPDRFLFAADSVTPQTEQQCLQTYRIHAPLLAELKLGQSRCC